MNSAEWFKDWFNSPYYHLLYNNRNENEAKFFIDNLCSHLNLQPNANVWDLACGKGRHAVCLNNKGYKVVGTDLSKNSIKEASQYSNATLDFYVHDMREPFRINYFDAVFNLFTSIGYFENFNDNFSVFKNIANSLKPNGVFVIDFFNSKKVASTLKTDYIEQRGDITFKIKKQIANNAISKRIEFNANNHQYYFEESVSLLKKEDFENFAKKAGFKIESVFGNYNLEPFDENKSERLIIIFKK
ncbi:MAG: class I SAM-dependent methyltransferase [Bacteroidota bacterium]|nr:class I SAM-dependent methyltransferase [Bacteroidota bacterium]MDP3145264.1 class I SAM-dependent methyltransferase [Bacteroidota bacterium]